MHRRTFLKGMMGTVAALLVPLKLEAKTPNPYIEDAKKIEEARKTAVETDTVQWSIEQVTYDNFTNHVKHVYRGVLPDDFPIKEYRPYPIVFFIRKEVWGSEDLMRRLQRRPGSVSTRMFVADLVYRQDTGEVIKNRWASIDEAIKHIGPLV